MTEIDREYFCSAEAFVATENIGGTKRKMCAIARYTDCGDKQKLVPCEKGCIFAHRKWPTPEQFEEEYGYKPYGLFYWIRIGGEWMPDEEESPSVYREDVNYGSCLNEIVVACTPYGKPPDNWRPKK